MKKLFLLLAAMLTMSSLALAADVYKIDGAHSSANFAVRHMGISTVRGRFTDVSGTILFDEAAPEKSSVMAVIRSTSVTTDNATRDKHLNTPDFFDTAKYPEIRFQSTSVRKVGDEQVCCDRESDDSGCNQTGGASVYAGAGQGDEGRASAGRGRRRLRSIALTITWPMTRRVWAWARK